MLLRTIILVALLSGFAPSQTLRGVNVSGVSLAPAGCGVYGDYGQYPYDQSTCGNVGNAYTSEGASTAAAWKTANSAVDVSVCGTLTAGFYQLTTNLTAASGDGTKCFDIATGAYLDLNSHTVNGTIYHNGNIQGLHLFNGTVSCTLPNIYYTGTVGVTNGSTSVTGSGTAWTATLNGGTLSVGATNATVSTVGGVTALTLSSNWTGSTNASASYSITNTRHGCVELDGGGEAITNTVWLHHLTVTNLATQNPTFAIWVDWSSAVSTSGYSVKLFNVTGDLRQCDANGDTICTRTDIARMNGNAAQNASLEAYNNNFVVPPNVLNGQGLELYQVANPYLHNNYCNLLNPPVGYEGRCLDADGDTGATEPSQGSNNAVMQYNYCVANSARCFRVRSSQSPNIQYNYMARITGTPGSNNAVHICDGGASSQTEAYTNAFVRFNTFEMAGGSGIFARWCTGYLVTDNLIKATTSAGTATGQFAYMNGTSGTVTMTFTRNANTLSPTSINVLNAGATITTCNSGTVTTSGGGTNPTTTC